MAGSTRSVLITASSSGIGRAASHAFADAGWHVIATMRDPAAAGDLAERDDVDVLALDVSDQASVDRATADAIALRGRVDAVVNNAGFAVSGVFEATSDAQIAREFEVNVFGLMRVTRAFIPHFRENRAGTFVQVSSVGGRITFPLFSTYHATKWAVEGFSESLQYELDQFGIDIRVIEPGVIVTDFYGRSADRADSSHLPDYAAFAGNVERVTMASASKAGPMEPVVRAIVDAASGSGPFRRAVGWPAYIVRLRRWLPEKMYLSAVRREYRK